MTKHSPQGNPQANATIERIHQVLSNIVRTYNIQETYVDDSDPWMDIIAVAEFLIKSRYYWNKPGKYGTISFWARHNNTNQLHRKLDIHISAETSTNLKIRNSQKLNKNQLTITTLEIKSWS